MLLEHRLEATRRGHVFEMSETRASGGKGVHGVVGPGSGTGSVLGWPAAVGGVGGVGVPPGMRFGLQDEMGLELEQSLSFCLVIGKHQKDGFELDLTVASVFDPVAKSFPNCLCNAVESDPHGQVMVAPNGDSGIVWVSKTVCLDHLAASALRSWYFLPFVRLEGGFLQEAQGGRVIPFADAGVVDVFGLSFRSMNVSSSMQDC